jgi:hypothetical protein
MWMVYFSMLDDYAREIANAINAFTSNVRRLSIWAGLLATFDDKERSEALHEFVDPMATLCLLTPYAVRSRLIFAAAHLCHQVNLEREEGWSEDKLPLDDDIWMGSADVQGAPWARRYTRLKARIEAIGGNGLKKATADFRNAFSHRFSPRVSTGITNFARREINPETGKIWYGIGGTAPLDLDELVALLASELDKCYLAFAAFQALVEAQLGYVRVENMRVLEALAAPE